MDLLAGIGQGFAVALSGANPLYALAGATIGTVVGVLPGLGAPATIALLLPVASRLDPTSAIIMLAGVFSGAMYGGSTTAILLRIPGESASIVTCLDGYPLARQGRAGAALAVAALASFVGGSVSMLLLSVVAPGVTQAALGFGPPEHTALVLLGLVATAFSAESRAKGLMMMAAGLIVGSIGIDPMFGAERFTLGSSFLLDGVDVVIAGMGLFGVAEVLSDRRQGDAAWTPSPPLAALWPTREDWRQSVPAIIRGTGLGFLIGVLPGGGATISAFAAYSVEKATARRPERFGHGAIEGVAAPEAANNAASTASFIPLLTLGIPGNAATAMIFAALTLHGVQPGPLLADAQPGLFWGVVASMYVANVMLVALNLPLVGVWARLLRIPYPYLVALVATLCTVGAYSLRVSIADVYLMVAFGFAGYVLRAMKFPVAALVVAMILGRLFERSFLRSLQMSGGDPGIFFVRPVSVLLLAACAALIVMPIARRWQRGGRRAGA